MRRTSTPLDPRENIQRDTQSTMRPLATITLFTFAASAASRVINGPFRSATVASFLSARQLRDDLQPNTTNTTIEVSADSPDPSDDPWSLDPDSEPEDGLTPEQEEAIWCKAKSRGVKLTKAMMMNDQEAATMLNWPYIQSTWDGDLKTELTKWGYNDNEELHKENDDQCDFDKTHEMKDAFKDLNVDTRSAGQGGPNHCFYIEHQNGPTVVRDKDGELPFAEDQYYVADNKKYQVC